MLIVFRRPLELPIDAFGVSDRGFATARVTSPFGPRNGVLHTGLDIGNARLGDTVVAAAKGTVFAVGNLRYPWSQPTTRWPSGNYGGMMIVIKHGPHTYSVYCHLRSTFVRVGAPVVAGARIAEIGNTGSALDGGGHLHFEILYVPVPLDGRFLMPRAYYRDPWPLITGLAIIEDNEVTDMPMRFGGAAYKMYGDGAPLPAFRTRQNARLRAEPSVPNGAIIKEFPEGVTIRPYAHINASGIPGGIVNGSPDWLEVRAYTGIGYEYGFMHASTLIPVSLPTPEAQQKLNRIAEIIND